MPKKGNGIYQRKDGRYEAIHYYGINPATGRPKKLTRYGKTAKEAKEKLQLAVAEFTTGTMLDSTNMTLEQWLNKWLEVYSKPNTKQSTFISYEGYVRGHIIPNIGKLKLSQLNAEILQDFFNRQYESGRLDGRGGVSAKTLRNMRNMFHYALQQACDNNLIQKNYIEQVKLPKVPQKEMRVLDDYEQFQLCTELNKTEERFGIGVYIALHTSMRIGEVCGLHWDDLDISPDGGVVRVRRTLGRLMKYPDKNGKQKEGEASTEIVETPPKSQKSVRDIPIDESVCKALRAYRNKIFEERAACREVYDKTGYVLCTEIGTHIEPSTLSDTYKRILADAGIKSANFHSLRHTFATNAIKLGIDPKTVSELLGHADVSVTLNRYAHSFDEQKRQAMKKIAAHLGT